MRRTIVGALLALIVVACCAACGLSGTRASLPRTTTTRSSRLHPQIEMPRLLPASTIQVFADSGIGPSAVGTFDWHGNLYMGTECYGSGTMTVELGHSGITKTARCSGIQGLFPTRTKLAGHGARLFTVYFHIDPGTNWRLAVGDVIVTSANL